MLSVISSSSGFERRNAPSLPKDKCPFRQAVLRPPYAMSKWSLCHQLLGPMSDQGITERVPMVHFNGRNQAID